VTQGRHRSCAQVVDRLAQGRGPSTPPQRAPLGNTPPNDWCCLDRRQHTFGDSAGDEVADLQNQAYMADSKDLNGASPNSNTSLANLSAAKHERL
jgi:hypothetical protein